MKNFILTLGLFSALLLANETAPQPAPIESAAMESTSAESTSAQNPATKSADSAQATPQATESQAPDPTSEQSADQASDQASDQSTPAPLEDPRYLELIAKPKSKSGFFVGFEVSGSVGNGKGKFEQWRINQTPVFALLTDLKSLASQSRLLLGYQKYFGKSEKVGLDAKLKLGAGMQSIEHVGTLMVAPNGQYETFEYDDEAGLKTFYVPLSAGLEVNLLYDFRRKAHETMGVRVGVGYEFAYGVNTHIGFRNEISQQLIGSHFNAYTDKNIFYHVISPRIGLHYYTGNHQFIMAVSFDKMLGESKNSNNAFDPPIGRVREFLITQLNFAMAFNCSYAYRF